MRRYSTGIRDFILGGGESIPMDDTAELISDLTCKLVELVSQDADFDQGELINGLV